MPFTTRRWGLARLITASPGRGCITILATMPRTFSIPTAIASRRSTRVGSTPRHNAFEFQGWGGSSRTWCKVIERLENVSSAVLNINVPTLVLAGENDQVERVATLER